MLSQDRFYESHWVAIIVEESKKVGFHLSVSLITAAMCINSAEKSLYEIAFVASWVVAVGMINAVRINSLR